MPRIITESEVEEVALEILSGLGYKTVYGQNIAPDAVNPERKTCSDIILVERLREAVNRINPNIPEEAKEEVVKQVLRVES